VTFALDGEGVVLKARRLHRLQHAATKAEVHLLGFGLLELDFSGQALDAKVNLNRHHWSTTAFIALM
jgi:hypothetical protein